MSAPNWIAYVIAYYRRLNFQFEINQTSKIVSQIQICIDEYVVQFSEITKERPSDSISLKYLLIGIVLI